MTAVIGIGAKPLTRSRKSPSVPLRGNAYTACDNVVWRQRIEETVFPASRVALVTP